MKAFRDPECPSYNACLTEAVKLNIHLDCGRCSKGATFLKNDKADIRKTMPNGGNPMEKEQKAIKECTKCEKEYPATNEYFSKNKATKDGLEYWCKTCKMKRQAEYREEKTKDGKKERGIQKLFPSFKAEITKTTYSPEQIVKALRKGMAIEIMDIIEGKLREGMNTIREKFEI